MKASRAYYYITAVGLFLSSVATAHGVHPKAGDMTPDPDWATRHMAEEHHVRHFDPSAFFVLHDFNSDGHWDPSEVRHFYGMDHPLTEQDPVHRPHSEQHKANAVRDVFALFDPEGTGVISYEQWMEHYGDEDDDDDDDKEDGMHRLPDFGFGPGHHGDDEYEYEIHHFEQFHGDGAREEDLTHPEDVEHFEMHERLEEEQEKIRKIESASGIIVEANIPVKFRKQGYSY